ncbi:MAG: protein translocase subunit SecF [Hydrogenophilales bacterium CG17_big_fil_post_rev_8_21_14_2_50_63_12]|nr:MAG: protein translocase subunit SecF [Hydrogenophilales bacterium CG17_big_fil_post_rev_8_21_14_2_50_63_12]PIX96176.1 MAG: protein translocase subunit SecF [Hydrogenophilales bacterium CG_4_10_14_3_um_filter_63_21]PJB04652.1 MAG: protein translocase subunit SecF [Hydrogenophilales bacterium CG_4_9_14_3_um_filter_63_34]
MELFHPKRDIPFMRFARSTIYVSIFFIVASIVLLATKGLNLGVDFTGGTVMEVSYPHPADVAGIRATLGKAGYPEVSVQNFGTSRDVLVRLPVKAGVTSAQLSEKVLLVLKQADASVLLKRVEFVGPQVGNELFADGALALLVVSIGIALYLALRFEWRFAVGAIFATAHDIFIVLGAFSLFQWEFSLTVLAAVLAIMGYSVNDTVVVFDRIRENFKKTRSDNVAAIMDNAKTATLSRTIITSGTTQLMVLSMLFLGGEVLYGFALALTIGIVVGTYSSVLVASPIVMWLGVSREDFIKKAVKPESGAMV